MTVEKIIFVALLAFTLSNCTKESSTAEEPQLNFSFSFNAEQARLNNFGQEVAVSSGNAAQTPDFKLLGIHYIELSQANDIPAYNGTVLLNSPTTTQGGSEAIDFDKARYTSGNENVFSMSLKDIPPGVYPYVRISLSYQKYDIDFWVNNVAYSGTLASFVGSNTYVKTFTINEKSLSINANKKQGFWAFEPHIANVSVIQGQAPATTVPNPLFATSAIPAGSCLVTGIFETPLVITGNETDNININCGISINNSFEWQDLNGNGLYEPTLNENVVDMGVRGLIPRIE
ncbi:MAG: hypothetical protein R2798_05325 [Chitinophagales bacterium]|nr:hypothetical protein [Bacteroidota bacterium]MCB9042661.1 hypothetical protein [Chitinophagales bacterium]